MKLWHLGNTTVRSPFRLRDGLIALSNSPLQGDLRGKEQEIALRRLLGEHGIVDLGDDETYSVGRKWRSALSKMGFLYPDFSDIGRLDTITPNGWRLIRAETVPAMQECFLRALAACCIPSTHQRSVFFPLQHTLSIMLELENKTKESWLNFIEMGLVVQLSNSDDNLTEIVDRVLDLRARRNASANKRLFDRQERDNAAQLHGYMAGTFNDYADTNFRYLKATGLLQSKRRGISLVPEKHLFIEQLIAKTAQPASKRELVITLCNGAALPTDNQDSALVVLDDLLRQLEHKGIPFNIANKPIDTPADIGIVRHQIEELLAKEKEEAYAGQQVAVWEEIDAYMELIITRRNRKTLPNGEDIEVPKAEAPAYFEWILWRAFLAINSLINKPYEARRFKIDQDFLPVGTAPGNGPDLIFEFDDYVLVVEVTLTTNSRQEAAEGEPVRRHVAELVAFYKEQSRKPVYGLFIANKIDSNTAETFRIGIWYTNTDEKMRLDIIPITLAQFKEVFKALFVSGQVNSAHIREFLEQCGNLRRTHEAPAWKHEIGGVVQQTVDQLLQ